MPYKYIGRTSDAHGKTLWEILGNLKNFGIGRFVARNKYERYPEPTYMKILKVEALPNPKNPKMDDVRKVKVTVEKVFRGKLLPNPIVIESASYKADYKLIPKDEESSYCKPPVDCPVKVLPKYTLFPPLLRELIITEMVASGKEVEEPKLEIVYREENFNKYRIAEDGEKATVEIAYGLGTPTHPSLYKGVL